MRVLLVLPNEGEQAGHYMANLGTSMPLGLGYLAAVLEKAGHAVDVLDFQIRGVTLERLAEMVGRRRYDVCGISTTTPFFQIAYAIAGEVRNVSPSTTIVLGGPHTVAVGRAVMEECPATDYAVYGEGEVTLLELLEVVKGARGPASVNGIGYRDGSDIVLTAEREFIQDIDSIPLPAYHLFSLRKYRPMIAWYRRLPWTNVITSRGCPYRCIYCNKQVWGYTCRLRSAGNVLEEVLLLKNEYGVREISFSDDTFTISKKRTMELCDRLIRAHNPVIWKCTTRADLVDLELLKALRRAGCYSIGFGVESGSDKILKIIDKRVTRAQVEEAFRDARKAGLETRAYFMLNLPHDTTETTEETIRFSREIDADYVDFEIAHPYPGTAFRKLIESDPRYTIVRDKWDDPKAQFGNHIVYLQPGLPEEALRRYLKEAFTGYYLRPRQILRHLRRLLIRPRLLWAGLKAAWSVLHVSVGD